MNPKSVNVTLIVLKKKEQVFDFYDDKIFFHYATTFPEFSEFENLMQCKVSEPKSYASDLQTPPFEIKLMYDS